MSLLKLNSDQRNGVFFLFMSALGILGWGKWLLFQWIEIFQKLMEPPGAEAVKEALVLFIPTLIVGTLIIGCFMFGLGLLGVFDGTGNKGSDS
jgi:hypothetical protein